MDVYTQSAGIIQFGAGVFDSVGSIMDSSGHTFYNCPKCNKRVWVVKGAPYRGTCAECIQKEPVLLAPVSLVGGFFRRIFN